MTDGTSRPAELKVRGWSDVGESGSTSLRSARASVAALQLPSLIFSNTLPACRCRAADHSSDEDKKKASNKDKKSTAPANEIAVVVLVRCWTDSRLAAGLIRDLAHALASRPCSCPCPWIPRVACAPVRAGISSGYPRRFLTCGHTSGRR